MAAPGSAPPRFLLYSHDGVGLGHVRRNLTIAVALRAARPDASVLLATGARGIEVLDVPDGVEILGLPGLRKLDNRRYAARRLGVPPDDVRALRADVLAAAVTAYRPDVLLADKHAGGVAGELLPALQELRAAGGRAAVGLRDVLDEPGRARREWAAARPALALHDLALLYGQADLLVPIPAGVAGDLGIPVRACGYVVARPAPAPTPTAGRRTPRVLAVAGGGEDGGPLLRRFVAAADGAGWDAVAVTGPMAAPAEHEALVRLGAERGVRVERSLRAVGTGLGGVDAVVCMGGYNTLLELAAAAVPAVCVPRVAPREEQLVRARAFAARGLLRVVEPDHADPGRLRVEVGRALATDRAALAARVREVLDLGGAERAAAELVALAATARRAAPPATRRRQEVPA